MAFGKQFERPTCSRRPLWFTASRLALLATQIKGSWVYTWLPWTGGHGLEVLLAGDGDEAELREFAASVPVHEVAHAPDRAELAGLVERSDAVLPAPGLPDRHPLFAAVADVGRPLLSEFDLAGAWDDRPVVAVTGTNGKTTVTMLLCEMLVAAGIPAVAVGNLDTPLVAAIDDPAPEVFVVEASSFRLARSRWFRPEVAVWLNFAEDHLDVHVDLATYRAAKERITAQQGPGDLAVLNADDPTVAGLAERLDAQSTGPEVWRFSVCDRADLGATSGQLRVHGEAVLAVEDLWASLPHDHANVLAAAGAAVRMGASIKRWRRLRQRSTVWLTGCEARRRGARRRALLRRLQGDCAPTSPRSPGSTRSC